MFVQLQCSDKLGLSLELGSFAAGVMISTTDLAPHTLEQVRFRIWTLWHKYWFVLDTTGNIMKNRISTSQTCCNFNPAFGTSTSIILSGYHESYELITPVYHAWFHCPYLSSLFVQIEPIRNFFAALFLASIGMLIHVQFLWNHVDILLASVILVIIVKTVIIATVVKGFRYNNKTSLLVSFRMDFFSYRRFRK